MTTYTLQAHATSGERYALRYDDTNTITGCHGPLHHSDVTALVDGTADLTLTELDYDAIEDDDFFNRTTWQPPILTA